MKCTGFRRYQCPYELKVAKDASSQTCNWDIYEGDEPHSHLKLNENISGIPQHYKFEGRIEKAVVGGKFPYEIYQDMLLKSPEMVVQMKEVQGAVHRLCKKLLAEFPEDSVGYLEKFLQQNTMSAMSGDHDVCVLPGWHVSARGRCMLGKV